VHLESSNQASEYLPFHVSAIKTSHEFSSI